MSKSLQPERLLALLREHEPSIIQAGFDEQGEPFLFIEPRDKADMSEPQRKALANLMLIAASGLLEGSLGAVLH